MSARALRAGILAMAAYIVLGTTAGQAFELTSPDIVNGATLHMAQVHSRCGGENRSPALSWSGAPKGTESFAISLFDTDANGGRVHSGCTLGRDVDDR